MRALLLGGCIALASLNTLAASDPVADALAATAAANKAAAESQLRVNSSADSATSLLQKYRTATWQAQQLQVYGQQLGQLLAAQEAEKISLRAQLIELERTERELTPLMLRMQQTLEKFVSLDLPFLRSERRERVDNLKRAMADPEVAIAEKYRRVLEAYQVEIDYGRSLGAERAEVEGREVDVLRVGRTALFFLSLDGAVAGRWDAAAKAWKPLDKHWRSSVKKALRVAREIAAPATFTLPMPAPVTP